MYIVGSPPLECICGRIIPFSRQWDTMRYSGIQQIQLDVAARYRYAWIQLDTVDSGIQ